MDAYPQPPCYPRPPPPPPSSTADPFHHHQPPPPPPPPQQSPWYSNQFQYQPPSTHSASPQYWAPPQDHGTSYHQPPPHGYSVQHHPPNHYPPPRQPPPHHWAPPPQSYHPPAHQGWGNANWGHPQAQKNEEDWAAKVKAWVEAKAAMDNQHPESQFSGPPEEQSHYPGHHAQVADFHYSESQYQQFSAPSYQQFPVPGANSHVSPGPHQVEFASISSGPSYYVADRLQPYTVANGTFSGHAAHSVQDNFPMKSSSLYQQEVPSSYSSVTGDGQPLDKKEPLYESHPLPDFSAQEEQHRLQQTLPSVPFGYGNSSDVTANIADQPLNFSKKYSHDDDPSIHINYAHLGSLGPGGGVESVAPVPPVQSWAPPVAPDAVYSSIPPAQQHDPSVAPFGSFPGAGFQSSIPSATVPSTLGSAPGIHATMGFPGDAYGISSVSERPKKASVPNWLREEIIKKKAVISNSLDKPKVAQSIEDEDVDKSIGESVMKGDQADSRSVDSSRCTEEDDDEDSVETTRTAAINLEIKRILTEVLLKVTDELFDEIATKVLNEDDPTVDAAVGHGTATSKDKLSSSPSAGTASRASAKILIPEKIRGSETGNISGKSSSSTPGNVLGLANYASDEEEDDEIQSSNLSNLKKDSNNGSLILRESNKLVAVYNGKYQGEDKEHIKGETNLENGTQRGKTVNPEYSSKAAPKERDNDNNVIDVKEADLGNSSLPKSYERENACVNSEMSAERVGIENEVDTDLQGKDAKVESEKSDRKVGTFSSGKNLVEAESVKFLEVKKRDENSRRVDERCDRKEKSDDRNGLKEKKDQIVQRENKAKEFESRKRSSHPEIAGDRKGTDKDRSSTRKDHSSKRERGKDREEDRSRHRNSREASQHKRRRSSSIESKGRSKKEFSNSRANASSDETSNDSRRKPRSRRRNSSPSPVRSRRQVSRSPHSKHDQHRHSPYSSLDTNRGRKLRSKSPKQRRK